MFWGLWTHYPSSLLSPPVSLPSRVQIPGAGPGGLGAEEEETVGDKGPLWPHNGDSQPCAGPPAAPPDNGEPVLRGAPWAPCVGAPSPRTALGTGDRAGESSWGACHGGGGRGRRGDRPHGRIWMVSLSRPKFPTAVARPALTGTASLLVPARGQFKHLRAQLPPADGGGRPHLAEALREFHEGGVEGDNSGGLRRIGYVPRVDGTVHGWAEGWVCHAGLGGRWKEDDSGRRSAGWCRQGRLQEEGAAEAGSVPLSSEPQPLAWGPHRTGAQRPLFLGPGLRCPGPRCSVPRQALPVEGMRTPGLPSWWRRQRQETWSQWV